MADTLYEVLKFLKRQEKARPDELYDLVYEFTLAWNAAFPDKAAFNELHFLVDHMPLFAETWEMVGIINEESFEAFHCRLSKVKDVLKSIPSHTQRINTINARMQRLLKEEIIDLTMKV